MSKRRIYRDGERNVNCGLSFEGVESRTKQEFKDECNMNIIMDNWLKTGRVPVNARPPQYGDFTLVSDYKTAVDAVHEAEARFGELPSKVRERFGNDPQLLLDFMDDPACEEEAIELGLLPKEALELEALVEGTREESKGPDAEVEPKSQESPVQGG